MKTQLVISIKIFALFTLLLGIAYPLIITGIAQLAFPEKANGSLITSGKKVLGSRLIGQRFDSIIYFSSRPSAPAYNPLPSGGSNYGPTSSKLKKFVADQNVHFRQFNNLDDAIKIPSEMVFSSASGLDPDISPDAAYLQVERIAKARNLTSDQKSNLMKSISSSCKYPQFGLFGERCVNVLNLNLELEYHY
jgi:K+-transporting ATPase ATPase C chain